MAEFIIIRHDKKRFPMTVEEFNRVNNSNVGVFYQMVYNKQIWTSLSMDELRKIAREYARNTLNSRSVTFKYI